MSFNPAAKRPPDEAYNAMLMAMLEVATPAMGITGGREEDGRRWLKVVFPREDQS